MNNFFGCTGQRRESFDMKRQQPLPGLTGYYAPLPGMASSPAGSITSMMTGAQSMTPPPSLSGSNSNLTLGMCIYKYIKVFISKPFHVANVQIV